MISDQTTPPSTLAANCAAMICGMNDPNANVGKITESTAAPTTLLPFYLTRQGRERNAL